MKLQTRSALSHMDKLRLILLTTLWLGANVSFWGWWLGHGAEFNLMYLAFSSGTFYIITFLPSMYLFYLWNMAVPIHIPVEEAEKAGMGRVALITLTVVGAEATEVVERQLKAMVAVEYPHDSWLLVDGRHSPELKDLCAQYGVYYFSRHEAEEWGAEQTQKWNAPEAPFKKKTKAGNVNAWLDAYHLCYSHFVQFDIDHNPIPQYLHKTLGYFADPKIKWVQAPSVYGNMGDWTARGSAEQELVLQGPLQSGFFGWSRTPFIIGSHCTYEVASILQIGGFQPTRAEDHLDTIELAALGYRGVFVPEIIAVGDGPETFGTYLAQQFAWAYSLMQILFWHTPRLVHKYGPKRVIQILFAQTWYPLWSISTLVLFLLPAIGILTGQKIADVGYLEYVLRSGIIASVGVLIWVFSRKWQQPQGLNLSWRGVILHIARWPVIVSALVQVLLRVEKPYMITPKGVNSGEEFSIKMHSFYLGLITINLCTVGIGFLVNSSTLIYSLFALQGAVFLLLVYITVLVMTKGWKDPKVWTKRGGAVMLAVFYVSILTVALIAVLPGVQF